MSEVTDGPPQERRGEGRDPPSRRLDHALVHDSDGHPQAASGLTRAGYKVTFVTTRYCLEPERMGKNMPVSIQNGVYMKKASAVVPEAVNKLKGTKSVTWVTPLETPPRHIIEGNVGPHRRSQVARRPRSAKSAGAGRGRVN